jgi:hypothetical protein
VVVIFIWLLISTACGQLQTAASTPAPTVASIQTPTAAPTTIPIATALATVQPTAVAAAPTSAPQPTVQANPTPQGSTAFKYFWPTSLPAGLVIEPAQSSADERAFSLEIAAPDGGQSSATIMGGPASQALQPPPATGSKPITIRGQQGLAFSTGAGVSLFWQEGGQQYAIRSSLGQEDALALAESLESLDLATWKGRLAAG